MPSLPEVREPFAWHTEPWGPALSCRALATVARHIFTSRELQLTDLRGWMLLASSLGVVPGRVLRLRQVHGNSVVVVARSDRGRTREAMAGDALVSDDPAVALAVRTADCAPILMADAETGAAGAVHAGWRGTAAGIVSAAVRQMQETFGTNPANLVVAIGPTIAPCCYEVGPELVDAFAAHGHERYLIDRWFVSPPPRRGERGRSTLRLDLIGSNRDQLILSGVPERAIHDSGLCTASHLDVLTSYRAEGGRAGRLAGVIRPAGPP